MNFSIVIPLYNEADNINQLNTELLSALKKLKNDNNKFEIIYVDDGSRDRTLDYLKKLKVHEFGEINLLAVNRDGMFSGLDINLFKIVKKYFPKKYIVLGGGLESFENLSFYQKITMTLT